MQISHLVADVKANCSTSRVMGSAGGKAHLEKRLRPFNVVRVRSGCPGAGKLRSTCLLETKYRDRCTACGILHF